MPTPERNLIFVSYAHEDHRWLEELRKALSPLVRDSELTVWTDDQITPGASWRDPIENALSQARIAILLVSQDFLASDFRFEVELPRLFAAADKRQLTVLWIPVSHSLWEATPIRHFQAAWDPAQPLSTLSHAERERALVDISRNVARVLREEAATTRDAARSFSSPAQTSTFLIRKVHLKNIRCFEDVTLDLLVDSRPSLRTVILGDNATGKTPLLRAIALGLCDESDATALLKRVPGRFVRSYRAERGSIEIELVRNGSDEPCRIRTGIFRTTSGSEVVRKELSGLTSLEDIFAVGYGTERTKPGIQSHDRYTTAAAVATLFDHDETLQNPELILRRQPVWLRDQLEKKLLGILMLDDDRGEIEASGKALDVTGPWGRQPLEVLSDGYRTTAQWILDFASWLVYAGRVSDPEGLSGIVLIDELEQHLHPQWQREIMARLRQHLPAVQLIVSSHSPVIARSIGSVEPGQAREKLIHLTQDKGGRVVVQETASLKGLTTDQVLASSAFDYLIQADPEVERVLAEASRLASKGSRRTREEERRYRRVKEIMSALLVPEGDTEIEREVRQELHERMKARIGELEEAVLEGAR